MIKEIIASSLNKIFYGTATVTAVVEASSFFPSWLEGPVKELGSLIFHFEWMEMFGAIALICLVIERMLRIRLHYLEIAEKEIIRDERDSK